MSKLPTLLTIMIAAVIANSTVALAQPSKTRVCGPSPNERLTTYLKLAEVQPDQIINNNGDPGVWESKTRRIQIGDHLIEWIDKVDGINSESSLKIDGFLIDLKGAESINEADENGKIDLGVVDDWRQIRLYNLFEGELIGLTVGPRSCTGLMCGVGAQIVFNVKNKKVTFFGTFRSEEEVRLFRFKNEETTYYLGKRFDGDPHGSEEASVTYTPYSLDARGNFTLVKPYFIKYTYYPDIFHPKTRTFTRATKPDRLAENWIEPIK